MLRAWVGRFIPPPLVSSLVSCNIRIIEGRVDQALHGRRRGWSDCDIGSVGRRAFEQNTFHGRCLHRDEQNTRIIQPIARKRETRFMASATGRQVPMLTTSLRYHSRANHDSTPETSLPRTHIKSAVYPSLE